MKSIINKYDINYKITKKFDKIDLTIQSYKFNFKIHFNSVSFDEFYFVTTKQIERFNIKEVNKFYQFIKGYYSDSLK